MLIVSSLLTVFGLANKMDLVRRVAPIFYNSGEQVISSSIRNVGQIISNRMSKKNDSENVIKTDGDAIPPSSTEYLVYNKLEAVFNWIQPLLLWHNRFKSFVFVVGYYFLTR